MLTGLDDEHLGIAAVAAGAQDYLVKGKADGGVLVRAIRYAVERRRAEASLLRLREEELAAAESARLERGLLPSPLLAGSPIRARSFYRSGRTRSVIGGDFFDAVLGRRDRARHRRRRLRARPRRGRPRRPAAGVVAGARAGRRRRAAAAAEAAAGAGQRAARPVAVHHRRDRRPASGRADPPGCTARVRLAGHPPPLVLGRRRTPSPRAWGCRWASPDASWAVGQVVLEPGWALLVHTDGLIEGRGAEPDELLWTEGLIDVLAGERDTDLDRLPERLVERAQQLNGGALVDDVAILLLSSDGAPSTPHRPMSR